MASRTTAKKESGRTVIRISLALVIGIAIIVAGAQYALPQGRAATGTGAAHLEIDLDTSNGICTTVDTTRTIGVGVTIPVALCLNDFASAPILGDLWQFWLLVNYPDAVLSAVNGPFNGTTDRDANPDANQTGVNLDCNLNNSAAAQPVADPSPLRIVCGGVPFGNSASTSALLATVTLTGEATGTANLVWTSTTLLVGGSGDTFCYQGFTCTGATITVVSPPTNTPTSTATQTPTDTATATSTATPTLSATNTPIWR